MNVTNPGPVVLDSVIGQAEEARKQCPSTASHQSLPPGSHPSEFLPVLTSHSGGQYVEKNKSNKPFSLQFAFRHQSNSNEN